MEADTLKHLSQYLTAAKKVAKLIQSVSEGDKDSEVLVHKAFARLDDRVYKPELRGDPEARAIIHKRDTELRAAFASAKEAGHIARKKSYEAESERLRLAERDRRSNMSQSDRDFENYRKELDLAQVRRETR